MLLTEWLGFLQAAAVQEDVRSKAKTVRQMVSELQEKKVSHCLQGCLMSTIPLACC